MNTVVAIVTYGNRFHLLKQVIDAVLAQGIDKIIVIDNDSEQESKDQLKALEKNLSDVLKVTYLDKNYGSASGYLEEKIYHLKIVFGFIYCKLKI